VILNCLKPYALVSHRATSKNVAARLSGRTWIQLNYLYSGHILRRVQVQESSVFDCVPIGARNGRRPLIYNLLHINAGYRSLMIPPPVGHNAWHPQRLM